MELISQLVSAANNFKIGKLIRMNNVQLLKSHQSHYLLVHNSIQFTSQNLDIENCYVETTNCIERDETHNEIIDICKVNCDNLTDDVSIQTRQMSKFNDNFTEK